MAELATEYYQEVGAFYDDNCTNYENLYWANSTLQRMRQSFREEVKKYRFQDVLEIGIGPGIDVVHFARIYPDSAICGIDISGKMMQYARDKLDNQKIPNATIRSGSVEDIEELFPGQKFDLIYVFFGALNTVRDLKQAMDYLTRATKPDGKMILTFVNKWYLLDIFINLIKLRPKKAFERLNETWGGYSPDRKITSFCYSPAQIKNSMNKDLRIISYKGYSILYPAWYRDGWTNRLGNRLSNLLWKIDQFLNKTWFWKYGEYTLFVIQKV
jgi:ubiquinone/menaquinone biosynthesis C-methylase UbiE